MVPAVLASKHVDWFFKLSAGLLVLTAAAKLYAATGNAKVLQVQDEVLQIAYRPLMVSAGLLEIGVAVFLVWGRSDLGRCLALLWLSANFLFYHVASYVLGARPCPCLGHLSDRLPMPPGMAEVILQVLALYWFLISLHHLWRDWLSARWARTCVRLRGGPERHAARTS